MKRRLAVGLMVGSLLIVSGFSDPSLTRASGPDVARFDYNGDGFADLAIGVPGENVNGKAAAGGVEILFGSANGLTAANSQFFTELTVPPIHRGVNFTTHQAQANDRFGFALTSGDFDHDGFADLAVGAPGQDLFDTNGNLTGPDYGAVFMLWGSADGLTTTVDAPDNGTTGGTEGEQLGSSLATLDIFNATTHSSTTGDGIDDLAVGSSHSGLVLVFEGFNRVSFLGSRNTLQVLDVDGVMSLTGGNVDGNPNDELIIGQPNASDPNSDFAGAGVVEIAHNADLFGNTSGMDRLDETSFGITEKAGDHMGTALALLGSGVKAVLAVGIPGRDVPFNGGTVGNAGAIVIAMQNLHTGFNEASTGVPTDPSPGDAFGSSLVVGSFGGPSGLDLVVGAPGKKVGTHDNAGAVFVHQPDNTWKLFSQKTTGVVGTPATGDHFGSTLAAANYGHTTFTDVAVGAPNDKEPSGLTNAGDVNVLYGSSTGLSAANDQIWNQTTTGVADQQETGDTFGAALR